MMKRILIFVLLLIVCASISMAQDAVYLESVSGTTTAPTPQLKTNVPIDFVINFRIESGNLTGCTNGFLFTSPDGATWSPIVTTTNPILPGFLDGGVFVNPIDNDGISPDLIGFSAFSLFAGGVPVGYDGWVMTHSTMFSDSDVGKTFCLDSSFLPPNGP